jgi:hypothetical protein
MRDKATLIFIVTGAVLVAFSAVAAVVSILHEGLGANGAAWVQAGGSIAAIVGAVWLFQSEAHLRRHERRVIGEESAWAVRFALTNAQLEARTIAAELVDESLLTKENPGRDWLVRSENCRDVLRVFAERTDHIHPVLNHIANNGALLLRQMDEDIRRALDFLKRGERPSIAVATAIAWYEVNFEELLQMLDSGMRGVLKALDEGRDTLPVRQWNTWEVTKDVDSLQKVKRK